MPSILIKSNAIKNEIILKERENSFYVLFIWKNWDEK